MKELATADESRDRRRSPAPEANAAAVGDHLGILSGMIKEYVETSNHGEAKEVAYDTDSSDGTCRDRGRSKSRKATTQRRSPVSSPSTSRSPSRSASPPLAQEVQTQGQEQGKGPRKIQGQNKKKEQKERLSPLRLRGSTPPQTPPRPGPVKIPLEQKIQKMAPRLDLRKDGHPVQGKRPVQ